MADEREELMRGLRKMAKSQITVTVIPAKVIAVDESAQTVDVEDMEGIEIYDVRMRAALDGSDAGWLLVPTNGSQVLIANIGDSPNDYAVIATTDVDKVTAKIDSLSWSLDADAFKASKGLTKLQVESDGVLIERNAQTLKAAIDALIDQVKLITVTCAAPGSPSTPPLNLAAFDVVKAQIDSILK